MKSDMFVQHAYSPRFICWMYAGVNQLWCKIALRRFSTVNCGCDLLPLTIKSIGTINKLQSKSFNVWVELMQGLSNNGVEMNYHTNIQHHIPTDFQGKQHAPVSIEREAKNAPQKEKKKFFISLKWTHSQSVIKTDS